jgi:hypothetical protein
MLLGELILVRTAPSLREAKTKSIFFFKIPRRIKHC